MSQSEGQSDSNVLKWIIVGNISVFIITILSFHVYRIRKGDHLNIQKKLKKEEKILLQKSARFFQNQNFNVRPSQRNIQDLNSQEQNKNGYSQITNKTSSQDSLNNEPQTSQKNANKDQKKQRFFDWILETYRREEEEVYKLAGYEVVLYLSFMKLSAILFLIMSLVGGIPLLIVYIKLSFTLKDQNISFTERISIKTFQNADQQQNAIIGIFLVYILIIIFAQVQIYFFDQKCEELKIKHNKNDLHLNLTVKQIIQKIESKHLEKDDIKQEYENLQIQQINDQIKSSTIIIQNIDKTLNCEKVSQFLSQLLKDFKKKENTSNSIFRFFKFCRSKTQEVQGSHPEEFSLNPEQKRSEEAARGKEDFGDQVIHVPANFNKVYYLLDQILQCNQFIDILLMQDQKVFNQLDQSQNRVFKDDEDSKKNDQKYCLINHYSNLRQKTMKKLKQKSDELKQTNIGFAFIFFDNQDKIQEFMNYFESRKKEYNSLKEGQHIHTSNWVIKMSPSPTDIIWKQYANKKPFDNIFNILMDILLFLITVIVSTPSNNAMILHKIFGKLNVMSFMDNSITQGKTYYRQLVEILAIAILNSFLIPFLIYNLNEQIKFQTNSAKDSYRLLKYYFYLFLNTILLPILQISQIIDFFNQLASTKGREKVQQQFSDNLIDKSLLFLKYLITCSFLSQSLVLLDMPHTLNKWIYSKITSEPKPITDFKKKLKDEKKNQKNFEIQQDIQFFDLGYNIAFNQIVYTMVLLYCLITPAISILGALYFTIKYFIDKYNLTVVYPKSYDCQGNLTKYISRLAKLTLVFQQLIMLGMFTITLQKQSFFWAIIVFWGFQIMIRFMFLCNFNFISEYFKKNGNFMTYEEEIKLEYKRGLLDEEGKIKYKQYLEDKENQKKEQHQNDHSSQAIKRQALFTKNKHSELDNLKEGERSFILQEYFHPVETFMLDYFSYFYPDFQKKSHQILQNLYNNEVENNRQKLWQILKDKKILKKNELDLENNQFIDKIERGQIISYLDLELKNLYQNSRFNQQKIVQNSSIAKKMKSRQMNIMDLNSNIIQKIIMLLIRFGSQRIPQIPSDYIESIFEEDE